MPNTASAKGFRWFASRVCLASGFLVLAATSAPPTWEVRDDQQTTLPELEPGDPLHRIAIVHLHLTTPRGTWPLMLYAGTDSYPTTWFEGNDAVSGTSHIRWESNCTKIDCTLGRNPLDSNPGNLQTICEDRVADCQMPTIEVDCDSDECVIDYDVTLHVRSDGSNLSEERVNATASFMGGIEEDGSGCQDKDSSTDSDSAPAGMELSIEFGNVMGDRSDPAVATAPPDGGSATVTTDAQVTDAQVTDAQVTDAQVSDAGVTDAQVSDAGVTDAAIKDASTNVPSELEP